MSYSVLGTLPNGTTVSIVDVSGSWYKVNAGSYKGKFVYSGYIDVTETTEIDDNNAAKYLYPALSATDLSKPSTANSTPKFLPRSDF
ncbi:SH3 domain-containing protein [bacterium]|nr:SH3 domain-containing protein [bacterium]